MVTRHKLSDAEIKIRICPKRVRWPEPSAGNVWAVAHRSVDAPHNFIRGVDTACGKIEEERDLSADAIARRRSEICDQSLRTLLNFAAFELGQKALSQNISTLGTMTAPDAQQSQMHETMSKALEDLEEGLQATRRFVLDRCKLRERA